MPVGHAKRLEAHCMPVIFAGYNRLACLQVPQMPRSPKVVIFCANDDNNRPTVYATCCGALQQYWMYKPSAEMLSIERINM